MKTESLIISKVKILAGLLVVFLLAACSPSQPVQEVTESETAEADIPFTPQEDAAPVEPADPPAEPPSDGVV